MFRFLCLALLSFAALDHVNAEFGMPELCKTPAGPDRCLIKHSRFNHNLRYEFNLASQDCYVINWSYTCPVPEGENNFDTYTACKNVCGGYA